MNFLALLAYRAGNKLYGPGSGHNHFAFWSTEVTTVDLNDRITEDILNMSGEGAEFDPELHGHFDTFEYGFTLDGQGIDCADEAIADHISADNVFFSYHPEIGVSIITRTFE